MESGFLGQFKDLGAIMALAFSAIGSGLGSYAAGMAAIGSWKRNFLQNKPVSFMLVAFVGAPLTQTIYGMIIMNRIAQSAASGHYLWGIGAFSGLAMGVSAYGQGKCAACASDALGETQKGFANYIVVLGIIETVALFVMVFSLGMIGKL